MRRTRLAALTAASLLGTALAAVPLTATQVAAAPGAAPGAGPAVADSPTGFSDSLTMPWQRKYEAQRQAALQKRLRTGGTGESERLARGVYGRVAQSGQDKIFVVLAEFGRTRHSAYCDSTETNACASPADGTQKVFAGPRHNKIPRPDRRVDNTTLWQKDFDRRHYRHMYFDRMKRFYEQQSSGKYTIDGQVTEWVRVPFNEARYGRDYCSTPESQQVVCNNTWFLVRDSLAYWTQSKVDAGWSQARIRRHLHTFDRQDRYDFDGDGDFRESDGYIDHFQIVHAGGDQASGNVTASGLVADPRHGTDAIWSHRWYAQVHPADGTTGPEGGAQFGGVEIGEGGVSDPNGANVAVPDNPTGVWVGDYTIQPENGGLGVFAHEFAHDLGLPDLYDTSGNTGGAENSTGFWSIMSSGSNPGRRSDAGIGDHPTGFGAWEKFQLGWLDYKVIRSGRVGKARLRPGQAVSDKADNGLIVLLPDKRVRVDLGAPCPECGERYFYSDSGDGLDTRMTHAVEGGGELTATVNYQIEEAYDYAFLEASDDDGETWTPVETSESSDVEDQSGFNTSGTGITGASAGWVDLTATVPAGADAIRFRYVTDSGVALNGFRVDDITLDGEVIGTAESDDEGWVFDGFRTTTGTEARRYLNAYFVDNRQYVRQDKTLKSVYNFGFLDKRPDFVEFFRYQPGALITYWDTSFTDNNVGDHPGGGQILPVDAHPTFDHMPDGSLVRPRIMSFDSTFSNRRVKGFTLHNLSQPYRVHGSKAAPVFNDLRDYWYGSDEHGSEHGRYDPGFYGVDVPRTGTTIRVLGTDERGYMTVRVGIARRR